MLRRASQLFRPVSTLDRADTSRVLDLPKRGTGSGERVARTFSVMGGLLGGFASFVGEAVGVTVSASVRGSAA